MNQRPSGYEIQKILLFVLFYDKKQGKTVFFHTISLINSIIFIVSHSHKGMRKGTKSCTFLYTHHDFYIKKRQ